MFFIRDGAARFENHRSGEVVASIAVLYRSNAKQCSRSGRPLGFVGCIQNVPHQQNLVLSVLSRAPGLNSSKATTNRHGEAAVGMDSLTAAENIALVLCDLHELRQ